jgi:hypothetical protein
MNNLHNPNETYEIAVRKVTQAPYDKEDLVAAPYPLPVLHPKKRWAEDLNQTRVCLLNNWLHFKWPFWLCCADRATPTYHSWAGGIIPGWSRHCLPAKFSGCSPSWVEAKSHLVVQALQVYCWGPACFAHFLLFFWNEIPKWRQPSPRESTYNLCWDFSAQGSHLTRPWLPAATGDPPVPNNPTASELQRGRIQEWETWLSFHFAEKLVESRDIPILAAHGMSTGYSVGKFIGDRRA